MRGQTTRIPFWGSLLSCTLILFFWGLFLLIAISFHVLAESALQNIQLKIILSDYAPPQSANELIRFVKGRQYAQKVKYISKAEALKKFESSGEKFLDAMDGVNPLPAIIQVQLRNDYVNIDSIKKLSQPILERNHVMEIYYPVREIAAVVNNMTKIRIAGVFIAGLLTFVAFLLVINTIKLAIYSKRLTIRTMQLIGATKGFIRKPFLRLGILQGLVSSLLAAFLLIGLIASTVFTNYLDLQILIHSIEVKILFVFLLIFGVFIGYAGSRMAVNRFLDKNLDSLYE